MAQLPEPITTPPSFEEMQVRLSNVRQRMEQAGLDFYVAAHTDNVYYLTNFAYIPFERPFFFIIPTSGKPIVIVPGLEVSHAQQRVIGEVEYEVYYEYPAPSGQGYQDALKRVIPADAAVGAESSLSLQLYQDIPGNKTITDIIDEVRLVKTDYEVGRIMYACQVVDAGLKKVFELSKPGVGELTLYSEGVRDMMGKVIMEVPHLNLLVSKFVCAVWPQTLSAQPHSVPGLFDTLSEGGPHVCIITAQADGYSAELERTYFIGHVPEEAKKPFEVFMKARALAYDLIKPGAKCDDVDRQVLQVIRDNGYEDAILHRTGHGFGITGHEPPWVALGSDTVLEKNMVVSIEPGVYLPEIGGFRHSDTVLVTDSGCVSMTSGPDQLEDLTLGI
jgi:Xaa-Pro dipeptidase